MEYLDYYDEEGNFLGKAPRDVIHHDALWHKTIHCWLYDKEGNVYFQIRKNSKRLYTTASGHVLAGETVEEAFAREIKEELGIDIDSSDAQFVEVVIWKMDREEPDGSMFRDRAFANIYIDDYSENDASKFHFDESEVLGLGKVKASDAIALFKEEVQEIDGILIKPVDGRNIEIEQKLKVEDFDVQKHETALSKYSAVLEKIIEVVNP